MGHFTSSMCAGSDSMRSAAAASATNFSSAAAGWPAMASEHFFRQTFISVLSGPPPSSERTLVGQPAPSEFCPRTLL